MFLMVRWLIILFFFFTPFYSIGQRSSFSFRNISINEGLSQSSVVDITTDGKGFTWFATQDGLNRYDGREFVIFRKNFDDITTPNGSRLGKVIYDDSDELWLLTSGGRLEKLNVYNETFTPVKKIGSDSILLPAVSSFRKDSRGNLWIGTEAEGLYICYNPKRKVVRYKAGSSGLAGNNIEQIFEDSYKNNWVLTDKGITLFSPAGAIIKSYLCGITANSAMIACSAIDEDKQKNIWLGSFGKGLFLKKKGGEDFIPFTGFDTSNQLPAGLIIESVMVDANNNVWVGTYGEGIFIINSNDSVVEHIVANKRDPFSLSYNDVLCIRQDKTGGVWIGTDGGGVNHYDKRLNNFKLLSKNTVPDNISIEQVRSITTDSDGALWIGTSNSGLTYADLNKNIFYTYHLSPFKKGVINYDRIVSLMEDKTGDIWIGTQGNGLLILDRKTKDIRKAFYPDAAPPFNLPDHTIWCMLPDAFNRVWVGTRNAGLCLIDRQKGFVKNFSSSNKLPDNNVRTLTTISDSIICVGFEKKGIRFLNIYNSEISAPASSLENVFADELILKCTFYKAPYLYIGTLGRGLIAYHIANGKTYVITEKKGLPNNTIYGILQDNHGSLWMSTNKGVCHFVPPDNLDNLNKSNFSFFTVEDGLQSNEFNTGAYWKAPDGRLLMGGINGLNIFRPDSFSVMEHPVPVVITQATVNNEAFESDTSISYKSILQLPYSDNSLSFNFAALDFISPSRFNYYYQLLQYDKGWVDAGTRNYAAYTNLPPGNYTFMVKASRQLSGKDDPVTTLNIVIRHPFWQSWWFILLCVLSLSALLYAFMRYRIRQILRLQQIRNRIATDLHDEIGSTLTNISLLSELSKKKLQEKQEASLFLDRISEEVSHSSQALDDIVWSINTNNDTLEQTVARMRRYAAEIFDAANINYTLQLDEQFANRRLNMEQRRDCFLIYKEAINNIYKHASAKNVSISVWLDRNQFHMEITDDGNGFNTRVLTHRNGLKNMKQRMEKWNGVVDIKSAVGKGTKISMQFSIA
jgi:ligand-binding sensor domain-containing protein/signal transduction histidine kinase